MKRLALILLLLVGTLSAAKKPNILLILPNQMRASAMGCMGNADVRTPHIDRLAACSDEGRIVWWSVQNGWPLTSKNYAQAMPAATSCTWTGCTTSGVSR